MWLNDAVWPINLLLSLSLSLSSRALSHAHTHRFSQQPVTTVVVQGQQPGVVYGTVLPSYYTDHHDRPFAMLCAVLNARACGHALLHLRVCVRQQAVF